MRSARTSKLVFAAHPLVAVLAIACHLRQEMLNLSPVGTLKQ